MDTRTTTHEAIANLESTSLIALDQKENPLNWSKAKKWSLSIIVINMSLTMGYFSGGHAVAISTVAEYFHTSMQFSTSGVSFFVLGFAMGPLLFAPLSEMYGRNPIIQVTLLLFLFCNIGCALAPNIALFLTFRGLAGLFGAPTGSHYPCALAWYWLAR